MKQILCLSHTPWQASPNRTQQLMTRLSDTKILFFEPPAPDGASRQDQGRRIRSHIIIYTLPAPFPTDPIRTFAQRWAIRRNISFIRSTMDRHHMRAPVLWCTAPNQNYVIGRIPYCGVVYDCHQEWGDEYVDQESELTTLADVVFAASPGLVSRLSPCSDNIALLPNGVSYAMFDRDEFSPPKELAHFSGKSVLGRVGDLTSQTVLTPLLDAAKEHPEWTFLLIGRVATKANAILSAYPNIVLTGPVNAVEIPDYLSVCSVLFDLAKDDLRGCDILPSRIYEYLATGKPTVMMVDPDYT